MFGHVFEFMYFQIRQCFQKRTRTSRNERETCSNNVEYWISSDVKLKINCNIFSKFQFKLDARVYFLKVNANVRYIHFMA